MKALLVGQAPSMRGNGIPAFSGRTGSAARLSKLVGMPVLDAFDAANLLGEWPGKQGKGDAFPAAAAESAARELLARGDHRVFVLMGKRVARAFGVGALDYFEEIEVVPLGKRLVVFPHPSGVNRWWNDEANVAKARRFLRKFARRRDG